MPRSWQLDEEAPCALDKCELVFTASQENKPAPHRLSCRQFFRMEKSPPSFCRFTGKLVVKISIGDKRPVPP